MVYNRVLLYPCKGATCKQILAEKKQFRQRDPSTEVHGNQVACLDDKPLPQPPLPLETWVGNQGISSALCLIKLS